MKRPNRLGRANACERLGSAFGAVLSHEGGQGLAEYALMLGLIAVVCVTAVVFLSGKIQNVLSNVGSKI